MPFGDWQFWIVSVLACGALWMIVRLFIPRRGASKSGCNACGTSGRSNDKGKSVRLTIDRKRL